ncbi:unnamed protein product [Acanthocheilonema viteae]|uniref:NOT2/NOT3/NOT5 C-terminal domain-containing protein n=1 Tax=Acanthocheilonema viteae TaxID=6277 RepID=A0A498SH35_ACAVI|nr:unnamed protein product [Acanthocheilonema viteae]
MAAISFRREIHLNYGGPWAEKPNYSSQADAREGLEHDDISVLLCLQPGKAQLTLQSDSCPYCQHIPNEYRTNLLLGDKLAELKFPLLEEDVLFYLFYNYPGEQYQIAAAYELYIREWRYHKMRRVWLRRFDYKSVKECTTIYEKGSYSVFDPFRWRKLSVKMVLFYKDLENKPTLPPAMKKYFDP